MPLVAAAGGRASPSAVVDPKLFSSGSAADCHGLLSAHQHIMYPCHTWRDSKHHSPLCPMATTRHPCVVPRRLDETGKGSGNLPPFLPSPHPPFPRTPPYAVDLTRLTKLGATSTTAIHNSTGTPPGVACPATHCTASPPGGAHCCHLAPHVVYTTIPHLSIWALPTDMASAEQPATLGHGRHTAPAPAPATAGAG